MCRVVKKAETRAPGTERLSPAPRPPWESSREMVLGVREKGQVHSRSQRTSRRPHELGSARLLVKFYQTWGARLFASGSAPLRVRTSSNVFPCEKWFIGVRKISAITQRHRLRYFGHIVREGMRATVKNDLLFPRTAGIPTTFTNIHNVHNDWCSMEFVHRFNVQYTITKGGVGPDPDVLLETVAAVKRAGRRVAPDVTPTITSVILDSDGLPRNARRARAGTLALARDKPL